MSDTVTVLLPVRDAEATLDETLASLWNQTLRSFRVVAVDDGSADGSAALLEAHATREPRLTVIRTGPRGLVLAHMRSRDRSTWDAFATAAAAEGIHVLTFDFRGYGASTGARDTALDTDLAAAVELLRSGRTRLTAEIRQALDEFSGQL